MKSHEIFRPLVLVVCAVTAACTAHREPDPSTPPPPARVTIASSGKTMYTSAAPVELKAMFGATPSFTLAIEGHSGAEAWSVTAMLDQAQALQGRAELRVASTPIEAGVANVTHVLADGTREQASAGTLTLTVDSGRISATVNTIPFELAGTVSGDASVSCWLPKVSQLAAGEVQQGTVGTGGAAGEVLVEDVGLAAAPCRALTTWRR